MRDGQYYDRYEHERRLAAESTTVARVLVVEDDAAVLLMLAEVLQDQGFCIASATTPELEHRLSCEFRPHIVIIGTDRTAPLSVDGALPWRSGGCGRGRVTFHGRLFDAALLKPFQIPELVVQIQRLMRLGRSTD